jgi:cell division protease FtsH
MFSGADLAALVNEAAIAATMTDKDSVEQADLEEARDKVRWGRARKSRVIDEAEKTTTAYHEAGHALAQMLSPGADPLHKVSIIPRGQMGGATFSLPEKDRYIYTRQYCQALLRVSLGGRLAEEIFCNDISSGASNDIAQATELARRMVLDWGMSPKLGLVRYSDDGRGPFDLGNKEYSEQTAQLIDQEIRGLIDDAYKQTRQLLEKHREAVVRLADALIRYETLGAEDVRRIIAGETFDKPTVHDLLDREHHRREQGVELSPPPAEPGPGAAPLPDLG